MNQDSMTDRFSICLLTDPETTQAINAIRQIQPPSPYRDDTPHVTLLRTIKCPKQISDNNLLRNMERLLELSSHLALTATIHKPTNRFSPLFRFSSLVPLNASPALKAYRKHVLKVLRAHGYSIMWYERLFFFPHISVRLGVPYTKITKEMAEHSFTSGATLTFSKWIILRDIKKDGKYLVKEIAMQQPHAD